MNRRLHRGAVVALLALIVLCVAWELWLAPLRPGGSWLVLKVAPLLFALTGVLKGRNYTLQWSTLLIWIYIAEGLVRAATDGGFSATLAFVEVLLASAFFICATMLLRPLKKLARQHSGRRT